MTTEAPEAPGTQPESQWAPPAEAAPLSTSSIATPEAAAPVDGIPKELALTDEQQAEAAAVAANQQAINEEFRSAPLMKPAEPLRFGGPDKPAVPETLPNTTQQPTTSVELNAAAERVVGIQTPTVAPPVAETPAGPVPPETTPTV